VSALEPFFDIHRYRSCPLVSRSGEDIRFAAMHICNWISYRCRDSRRLESNAEISVHSLKQTLGQILEYIACLPSQHVFDNGRLIKLLGEALGADTD
jgi:hypothetical protein